MTTPLWTRHSLGAFIADAVYQGTITLVIENRPDVATRRWYQLTWTGEDERQHEVSGSSLEIVLRRAAEREERARAEDAAQRGEEQP